MGESAVVSMLKQLTLDVAEIKSQNTSVANRLTEICEELATFKKDVRSDITHLEKETEDLKCEVKTLKQKVNTLEQKSRNYNLVVYNLDVEENDDNIKTALKLIKGKLRTECSDKDIRDCFRLGKKAETKKNPLLIEFNSKHIKNRILENAKLLKGTGIYISIDYTSEQYQTRKFLLSQQKAARQKNQKAIIKGNSLIINGVAHDYQSLKQSFEDQNILDGTNCVDGKEETGETASGDSLNREESSSKKISKNLRSNKHTQRK